MIVGVIGVSAVVFMNRCDWLKWCDEIPGLDELFKGFTSKPDPAPAPAPAPAVTAASKPEPKPISPTTTLTQGSKSPSPGKVISGNELFRHQLRSIDNNANAYCSKPENKNLMVCKGRANFGFGRNTSSALTLSMYGQRLSI